ncbi:MAG TPA: F0F1 ATP synthase subunit B [Ignavibacteriales bacterium]|nr:F0F1 ATP synthase subunit B [Ignavibacteriales bacterium]
MFVKLNLALIALLETEEGKPSLLAVNPGLIFWTVVTFVVLLIILKKVAWKPILGVLDERENYIKDSLDRAEKARLEAEKLLEENREALAKTEEEAQKIIAQGREFAEKLKEQIISDSRQEAKKMLEEASAEIRRKNDEAFESLKSQVALIAIQAAEKILKENLDKEKQMHLVDRFIDDLPKN